MRTSEPHHACTRLKPRAFLHIAAVFLSCLVGGRLLTACAESANDSVELGNAVIRTLAYVVTECEVDALGVGFISQELRIRVGEHDASPVRGVNVKIEGRLFPHLCRILGSDRFGQGLQALLAFKRLGVTPDGGRVLFEVSLPPSVLITFVSQATLTVDEGIYSVRPDGTDLRRLGPPSREAPFRLRGLQIGHLTFPGFALSPDGRYAVFTDLGDGPSGEEAIQIVSLEVETGTRRQLTHLPLGVGDPCEVVSGRTCRPGTAGPFFLDDAQIAFFTTANPDGMNPSGELTAFVVRIDGTQLHSGPHPESVPNGVLDPRFVITGSEPSVVVLPLDAPPEGPADPGIREFFPYSLEVFLLDGENLLQLTNFRQNDISGAVLTADRQRVVFATSANPVTFGSDQEHVRRNPTENCQLFSIDRNGGDLRQLTEFREAADHSVIGCYFDPQLPGCQSGFLDLDPITGTVVFYSNCDPFGRNPRGGQIFAVRPDGSGLRQLTDARGFSVRAGGGDAFELVGPHAYSAPVRSTRPR